MPAVHGSSPFWGQTGTLLCTAGAALQPVPLGVSCQSGSPSREPPAMVPGCEDRENDPMLEQEADHYFLPHRLQAASWGIIWENNGPFLPLISLTLGHVQ